MARSGETSTDVLPAGATATELEAMRRAIDIARRGPAHGPNPRVGAVLLAPLTDSWNVAIVGASGAVFGLFGAILVVLRRVGGDVRGILGVIVVNLVIGFVPGLGIAWQAHVGGLVVGLALGFAYAHAPAPRRRLVAVAAPVVVAVLLVASTVLTYRSVGLL